MMTTMEIRARAANEKSSRFFHAVLACLFATLAIFGVAQSQEQVLEDSNVQGLLHAITENEALLEKYPANDFTPNLMFQLAELYVKRARYEFQEAMQRFEEAEREFDAGLRKQEPTLPKIDLSAALEMCYRLIEQYPNVPFRDKVMYRIAVCHLEQGDKNKSIQFLESLSEETTERQYLEEAYFRLGEYHFDQKDYATAITYYRRLLNSWDSPYFDMALYKLGWSYYNVDDYAQAISTLIYLIDDINLLEEVDTEYLGKTNADLRSEAIDYVAVCFADYGGPQKARMFLSDRKDKAYTESILLTLAEVFQKRNFYEEAIDALKIVLDFYPTRPQAPIIQKQIVENHELAGQKGKADEARVRFVAKYGPGSQWFQSVKDDSLRQNALHVTEEFLYSLGTDAQARAQAERSRLQYGLAINRYQAYLDKFPGTERSAKVLFYLSECLFEIGRYSEAAESYHQVVENYPDSEFRETSAYNRILAYNTMLKNNGHILPTRFPLSNFLGKNPARVDTIQAKNPEQALLIEASNDFVVNFGGSGKLPEVLMKYAETLYQLDEFTLAKDIYREVTKLPSGRSFLPQAYSMIAQCAFREGNFDESEEWFRRLTSEFPDSTRFVERANKMIASSRFKVAESHLETGDSTLAAQEFERVASTVSEKDVAERALFEAAKLYENNGDKLRAITVYESIASKFPKSELVANATFKAAVLSEELQDWNRAAANYLKVYQHDPNSQLASKSLFLAAKCYESDGNLNNARLYYDEYVRTYQDDPDRYIEAAFRKAEIAYNQNQFAQALQDFRLVTTAFDRFASQSILVEKYLPANAQFLIGEILFENFKNITLSPPVEANLKRKRAKFEEVIKAYAGAARYKVADWTTASSYRIGLTFEDFANTLLDSPRPQSLSGAALVEYNQKLWENVLPFKKKALSTYQANIKQAMENDIDNHWIQESKKRMEALTIELGLSKDKLGQASGS